MAGNDAVVKTPGGDFGTTTATADNEGKDWFKLLTTGFEGKDQGFLSDFSGLFDANVKIKKGTLDKALQAVTADASDPAALAKYQAALAEYTLYRNAQSNAVKAYKDVDANTIRNFN
jgi:type III secretion protein F